MSEVIATIKQFSAVFPDRGGAIFKSFAWHFRRGQEFPLASIVYFRGVDDRTTSILEELACLNTQSKCGENPLSKIEFCDVIIVDPTRKPHAFTSEVIPLDLQNFWKFYLPQEHYRLLKSDAFLALFEMTREYNPSFDAFRCSDCWLARRHVFDAFRFYTSLMLVKFWAAVFHRKDVDPQIEFLEYLWTHGNYPVGFCWNKERGYRELVVFAAKDSVVESGR
jgi:hypothetical protein